MPTLREFTDAHVLGSSLSIDWETPADALATQINEAVNALEASLQDAAHGETINCNLHLWHPAHKLPYLSTQPVGSVC